MGFLFQVQIYELEEHKLETWRGKYLLIIGAHLQHIFWSLCGI